MGIDENVVQGIGEPGRGQQAALVGVTGAGGNAASIGRLLLDPLSIGRARLPPSATGWASPLTLADPASKHGSREADHFDVP